MLNDLLRYFDSCTCLKSIVYGSIRVVGKMKALK